MKSCVLLLIFFVPTAESTAFVRIDHWHFQTFSASGCNAADKLEDDYKALGVCFKETETEWAKAVGTATTYTLTGYTDSACTIECTSECATMSSPKTANASCSERISTDPANPLSKWRAGSVSTTAYTFRGSGPYTDNACTTLADEGKVDYHAMNICKQRHDWTDGVADGSEKYVCTATTITEMKYASKDCSGTAKTGKIFTSGDVCHENQEDSNKPGTFRKYNCVGDPTVATASGACAVVAPVVLPMLSLAALFIVA